ncbi:MAG: TVP38/TMEM64 family protein [Cyanobacteria bacterium P01_G01_bin.49]
MALLSFLLPTEELANVINQWLKSLGPWGLPAFVLIYVTASVFALPNVVFLLVAGTVFGLLKGVLSASIADTVAAIACFWLGRTLIRDRVKSWLEENSQFVQLDRAVTEKGWKILLLSRLAPIIPSNILNYGFSLTEVKFWEYLLCTWVGMLPIVSFYVYMGYFGMNLLGNNTKPSVLALQSVGLVIAIGVAIYTTHLAQKALSPSEDTNN